MDPRRRKEKTKRNEGCDLLRLPRVLCFTLSTLYCTLFLCVDSASRFLANVENLRFSARELAFMHVTNLSTSSCSQGESLTIARLDKSELGVQSLPRSSDYAADSIVSVRRHVKSRDKVSIKSDGIDADASTA